MDTIHPFSIFADMQEPRSVKKDVCLVFATSEEYTTLLDNHMWDLILPPSNQ